MTTASTRIEDIWHAVSADLRSFLRSRLPSDADADDQLQNVFVRVIERIGSLREADRIESWIYQVARNTIADFYRRRKLLQVDEFEEVAYVNPEETSGDQNYAIGTWLSEMIDALPKKQRDAVRMYEIEGLSQAEIAARLDISLSGAKSRVQRGRRELEKLLQSCCKLELDRRGNVIECNPSRQNSCATRSCECSGESI